MEMKYRSVFHLLANELGKAKISFVLIGGFAVNYYKATRFTGDVDILIDEKDFQKVFPFRFLELPVRTERQQQKT